MKIVNTFVIPVIQGIKVDALLSGHIINSMESQKNILYDELLAFFRDAEGKFVYRAWIRSDQIEVYLRKAHRLINGQKVTTLDIANVIIQPNNRGQGIFTNFINMAHSANPYDITYIEGAVEDRLAKFLWNNGWTAENNWSRAFYKIKNKGSLKDAWTNN